MTTTWYWVRYGMSVSVRCPACIPIGLKPKQVVGIEPHNDKCDKCGKQSH